MSKSQGTKSAEVFFEKTGAAQRGRETKEGEAFRPTRHGSYGAMILFGTLLFLVLTKPAAPEPERPLMMELDRDRIRTFGVMLKIASEEMIAVADSENIEEHLIVKAEQVYDDFAKEADFPGPDRITKPLARKMVRPVVKTIIRYVDRKGQELSAQEEKNRNE